MVYIKGENMQKKKERKKLVGTLNSITSKSDAIIDKEKRIFKWILISVCIPDIGGDKEKHQWFNIISAGDKVDFSQLDELRKADDMLINKIKPKVELEYYMSSSIEKDTDGNEIIDENGNAKVKITLKVSEKDLQKFKIISEGGEEVEPEKLVEEKVEA